MSDVTKKGRRDSIMALAGVYDVPVKLSPGHIDQCAEFGRDDVFWSLFGDYSHLFRVNGTSFTHGDSWPAGFLGLAKRYYFVDTNSIKQTVRYSQVSGLPQLRQNNRIKGTTANPVLYLSDGKFYFLPDSPPLTGIFIDYFQYPIPMADPAVADTTTDTMPKFSEPDIARAGFERMLKMQLDEKTALELTQAEVESTKTALINLYTEMFEMQVDKPLSDD